MALLSNPYIGDDDATSWPDPAAEDAANEPDALERLRLLGRRAARVVAWEQRPPMRRECVTLRGPR